MYNKSVSKDLFDTIVELMKIPSLEQFLLGGGTNLAIKYNYRTSTDIDLFSDRTIGLTKFKHILNDLKTIYPTSDLLLNNSSFENLSFIRGFISKGNYKVKIDVIQNIPFRHPSTKIDGIRMINDLDIGALKLVAAGSRGSRKDFYDLHFLTELYGFEKIFQEYQVRENLFPDDKYENIFNSLEDRITSLSKSLTPLCNFEMANLSQKSNFTVTNPELDKLGWFNIREHWKKKVVAFANANNIDFQETSNKRKSKGFKF